MMIRYTCSHSVLSCKKRYALLISLCLCSNALLKVKKGKQPLNHQYWAVIVMQIQRSQWYQLRPLANIVMFEMVNFFDPPTADVVLIFCDLFTFSMSPLVTQSMDHLSLDPSVELTV
jgi:hypothetical protein